MERIYLFFIALIVPAILFAQDCPGDIDVDNDTGICGAVVTYTAPSSDGATVTQIDDSGLTSGDEFPVGETIQEYEFDYDGGETSTCSFTITVNDTEPPSLSCPGDITVNSDPGQDGAMVNIPMPYNNNPAVTETVDILLMYADYDAHAQDVKARLEATGNFSTIHTFNISSRVPEAAPLIEDYNAVLLWRNNTFYEPEELGNVLAEYVDAGGGLVLAVFGNSVTTYPSGAFETDEYGVIVPDVIRYGPEAELGEVFLPDHPLMNGANSFNGGTESYRSWSTTLTPGSYRVADWDDNDYNLPLIAAKENVGPSNARRVDLNFFPPAITGYGKEPWDVNTDGDLILANALMWTAGAPTSYDNCSTVEISNDYNEDTSPSDYYPIGSTLVTLTASDEAGNTSTCSFTVTVEDNEPPVVDCRSLIIYLRSNGTYTLSRSNIETIAGINEQTGNTSDNYTPAGELEVSVSPRTFSCDQAQSDVNVTVSVTDEAGNTTTCETTVKVIDAVDPEAVCRDTEIFIDEDGVAELLPEDLDAGSSDGCGIEKMEVSKDNFGCDELGEHNVTLTVWDPTGNKSTCSATVTVKDTLSPTFEPVSDIQVNVDREVTETTVDYPEIITGDNCTFTLEQTEGLGPDGKFPLGTTTETWVATDSSDNTSSLSFNVVVTQSNAAPYVVNPIDDQLVNATYLLKLPVSPDLGEIFDDESDDVLSIDILPEEWEELPDWMEYTSDTLFAMPEVTDTGCVTLVVTATDLSGATATDTFQLCVADSPPVNVGNFDAGQFGVKLYPNPTLGEVTIDIDAPDLGEVGLSVFGINGKHILRRSYGATDRITFDMSGHVSGMYFVKIDVDGRQVLKKLILKRD